MEAEVTLGEARPIVARGSPLPVPHLPRSLALARSSSTSLLSVAGSVAGSTTGVESYKKQDCEERISSVLGSDRVHAFIVYFLSLRAELHSSSSSILRRRSSPFSSFIAVLITVFAYVS